MIRTAFHALHAALVAGAVATTAAAPAHAGGSLSVSIAPTNADEERAIRTGLAVYAISQGIRDGSIRQNGFGNAAGLIQNGSGNLGIVHQEGDGHTGTISQNGDGNAYGLFQFGRNTEGHVAQNGNGNAGATFQFGW